MQPVDYDVVAAAYDRRYDANRYDGIDERLAAFVAGAADGAVAEVGCGTGHWLARLTADERYRIVAGLDASAAMLSRAYSAAPTALVVRATAQSLPWASGSFDRLFCINALHHFTDSAAFFSECVRVLRPGGGFMTIGLDPHTGTDTWWVYDYFPAALIADRARYAATSALRSNLRAAGFRTAETTVAQHLPAELPFAEAKAQGFVDRHAASQLMVIPDRDYAAGLSRMTAERPVLRADLRLYATTAWL